MKKLNKIIGTLCIMVMAGVLSLVLVGCKDDEKFNIAKGVKANTSASIQYLVDNIYNSSKLGTKTEYSVAQIKENFNDFNYYIAVGTLKNIGEVKEVTLNEVTFKKDEEFKLSIGNSNFIKDKAFYVEDDTLYMASVVIAFEQVNNDEIEINDKDFKFDLNTSADSLTLTNVKFQSGSTNTCTKVENKTNEYNININNATQWLEMYYEGAEASDYVVTRKVLNGKLNGYGLTTVENLTGYPLAFYPAGYKTNIDDVSTSYDNATMNYNFYVVGKGLGNVKLNYTIARTAE